jgi:hypothetical protein
MKLYTEKQVVEALWQKEHPFSDGKNVDEIMKSLSPIELPSDEEIEERIGFEYPATYQNAFKEGAKWMRDKIKGGNNEIR